MNRHQPHRTARVLTFAAAIGLAASISQALAAQTVAAPADARAPANVDKKPTQPKDVTQLPNITVTATKQEKSVDEIPGSVSVITGDELEQRGAQDLHDILKLVPGVNLTEPSGNATRITIRGIAGEANTNPTTGLLLGDVSLTDSYIPHFTVDPNPFDMQDVEVLKGPQGTLYGASALNGAIRYVPQAPELGVFDGKYYAQYSSVSSGQSAPEFGAVVNIPLDKDGKVAARITAFDRDIPGYVDNVLTRDRDANRGRQTGVRAAVTWQPTEAFSGTFTYDEQHTRRNDTSATNNFVGFLQNDDKPRASPSRYNYDVLSMALKYNFGAFTLTSESAYVGKRFYGIGESSGSVEHSPYQPVLKTLNSNHSNTLSQELRLSSNDDKDSPWSWVAGVYGSRQVLHEQDAYLLGDPSVPPLDTAQTLNNFLFPLGSVWYALGQPDYSRIGIDVEVKEIAGFFNVTRRLGDWDVNLGGRLYRASSGGTVDMSGLATLISGYGLAGRTLDNTVRNDGFNPKASLTWHVTDRAMIYALASKGYRVGGLQQGIAPAGAIRQAPDSFKTDTIWNYELGTRTQWLDNTLQVNATAFLERWKNPQVLVLSDTTSYIDNVGGVRSKGVELATQYLTPIKGLMLSLTGAYTDARTTAAFVNSLGAIEPSGSPWPLSPKWQTATSLNYQHGFGSWTLGGFLTHTYLGKAIYGIAQPSTVFGYSQWDAQVFLGNVSLPSSPVLSFGVSNLRNKRGVTTAFAGAAFESATYIRPRTYMLRLTGSF